VVAERGGDHRAIPLRIADTLYRIGLEAVANAVRHAQPTLLTIRLKFLQNAACLQIEDNGCGFTPGNGLQGFGLRGMKRRAQSISAAFQIDSSPGQGTRIQIVAPLPPRVTLATWPKVFWKYAREHWFDARTSKRTDSHPHRR
jgi:signal transduction histidine kinase